MDCTDTASHDFADSRLSWIVEALSVVALARIKATSGGTAFDDDPDAPEISGAIDFVYAVAQLDARSGRAPARWPFGHEPALHTHYLAAYDNQVAVLLYEVDQVATPNGHMVYCPRGCNSQWTTARHETCGACGQAMAAGFDQAFHESLVRGGQLV